MYIFHFQNHIRQQTTANDYSRLQTFVQRLGLDRYQKQFNKLLWMRYNLPGVGEVKLMVGIVRRTNDKAQYCITVIKT